MGSDSEAMSVFMELLAELRDLTRKAFYEDNLVCVSWEYGLEHITAGTEQPWVCILSERGAGHIVMCSGTSGEDALRNLIRRFRAEISPSREAAGG